MPQVWALWLPDFHTNSLPKMFIQEYSSKTSQLAWDAAYPWVYGLEYPLSSTAPYLWAWEKSLRAGVWKTGPPTMTHTSCQGSLIQDNQPRRSDSNFGEMLLEFPDLHTGYRVLVLWQKYRNFFPFNQELWTLEAFHYLSSEHSARQMQWQEPPAAFVHRGSQEPIWYLRNIF